MKIFGHPVHIMLVHFPAALFPFEFVCSLVGFYTGDKIFITAAFPAMAGGVLAGWAAAGFGVLDLLKIDRTAKPEAGTTALIHASINICVLIAYTVLAYSQYRNYPRLETDGASVLVFKAAILGLLFAGNYFGGKLILKHRIAVED